MMFRTIPTLVFVASAMAQSGGPAASVMVRAGDVVLTLHGVCSPSDKVLLSDTQDCSTVMSREDFDDLVKIAAPHAASSAETRQSLVKSYVDLVGLAAAARKVGIEDSPQFQRTMELLRLRTLADMYRKTLEAEAKIVSDDAVEAYYQGHGAEFEEVKLRRLVIPKSNLAMADAEEYERKAVQIAGEMRDRAAKGEDLDQLQKDAYTALGFSAIPPSTDVGNRRRASLTPDVALDVFSLTAGKVSKVEKEAYGLVVYRVEAKATLPKQRVKDEIVREIAKQKLEIGLKSAKDGIRAELNEKYFGATTITQ